MAEQSGLTYRAIHVDGTRYPADLSAIDARQVVWMRRELAVSPLEMVARLAMGVAELPEVVALMALSIEQAGEEVHLGSLLSSVTLSSSIEIETDDRVPAPA